ncbi:MAG: hypothetical protein ACRDYW_12005 [Acidimicrobiales bacterium]
MTSMPRSVRWGAVAGGGLAALVFGWLLLGGRLDGLLAEGPFTSDFYDAQARALLDGRVSVPASVAGVEGFDTGSDTQLYFGIFPALLRLPIAAISSGFDGRLGVVSMAVAFLVLLVATARLCWRARQHWAADLVAGGDPLVLGWFVFSVGASSPVVVLAAHPAVYFESLLWAVALTIATFDQVAAIALRWSWRRLLFASALASAALSSRASVGLAAVAALGIAVLLGRANISSPRRWAMATLAVVLPIAAYGAVNAARFGDPLSIPWSQQVYSETDADRRSALASTNGRLLGPQYVPTAMVQYLRPDSIRVEPLVPWVGFRDTVVIGDIQHDIEEPASSLPNLAPVLTAAGIVGLVGMTRRSNGAGLWRGLAAAGAVGTIGVLTIASIANRYTADFVPLLVATSVPGVWIVARRAAQRRPGGRVIVAAAVALTVVGTLTATSLTLVTQRLQLFPTDETIASFVDLQYRWHDRIPGGRPPHVERFAELPRLDDVPGGHVALVRRCAGTYYAAEGRWVALERGPGRRFDLEGTVPRRGRTVLLESPGWSADLVTQDDGVVLVAGAPERQGSIGLTALVPGQTTRLVVEADPVGGVVRLGDSGGWDLSVYGLSLPPDIASGPAWRARPVMTPFCDRLTARLDE